MKTIRNIIIGLLFMIGVSSCSTIGPPPDGPGVVYYTYPSYYYYRPVPPPRYYRPVPPPPKPRPNTPPPRPNNGNRRHR